MMNNTGRVLGFNFYEMWQMPHADESFALIMVKLNKEVPEMMDDTYVESIIYQLRQLGSGEVFVDYARKEVDSVRSQISKQALRELSAENLVANHVYRGGCVETGAPCMYSNGPCSCLPGYCPFGQWNALDEGFIQRQLAKLRSKEDVARAEEEIRRAPSRNRNRLAVSKKSQLKSRLCPNRSRLQRLVVSKQYITFIIRKLRLSFFCLPVFRRHLFASSRESVSLFF